MGPIPKVVLGSVPTLREKRIWDRSQTGIGTSHYNLKSSAARLSEDKRLEIPLHKASYAHIATYLQCMAS